MRRLLDGYADFTVVAEARDGTEVVAAVASSAPHVMFLDIEMPELSGIEAVRRLQRDAMPLIVFLTAYDEFAVQAFDIEAVDYLVKPVTQERFATAMGRIVRRLTQPAFTPPATISVTTARGTMIIPLHEIDWIEAADYYSRIWVGDRSYLLRTSLVQLEQRVRPHGFVRAHRQALVRTSGVRALKTAGDGDLFAVLACGITVPVSRRRRRAFTDAVRGI
jgi:two-component system LytT family response regulator